MDLGIAGKTALVTGGSKGIGRAIAEELGRNGCQVFVVARGQEYIDQTVRAIRDAGGTAAGGSADLTRLDDYPSMVEQCRAAFGAPDIAIFAPVAPPAGRFDQMSDDDLKESFDNIVLAFAHFIRSVTPAMKKCRWGRVLTVGSGHARLPARLETLGFEYALANTTRPAGLGLTRTIADELAPYGVTTNTVAPGHIDTGQQYEDFFRGCAANVDQTYEEFMQTLTGRIPMKRFGTADEVASMSVFLCSARASYITGQYVIVDGGRQEIFY